jgi:hypothetical protein
MRNLQLSLLGLGVVSFLAAALFIGQNAGDTLWRAGVAILLVDLNLEKLWPHKS